MTRTTDTDSSATDSSVPGERPARAHRSSGPTRRAGVRTGGNPGAARRFSGRVATLMLAAVLGALAFAVPAHADRLSELEEERAQLEQQRRQNEQEHEEVTSALEGTNADLAETYLELDSINRRLPIAEAELVQANEELAAAERHRDSVQGRLEVAQAQREDLQAEISEGEEEMAGTESAMGEVARSTYRGGPGLSAITVVLDASSPSEFANQYSAMNSAMRTQNQALADLENLSAINRNRQVRLEAVEERIEELRVEAEEAVAAADAAQQEAEALVAEIEELKAEQEVRAAELEELSAEYENQQEELESANEALAAEIAEIAEQESAERERQREAERRRQEELRRQQEQQRQQQQQQSSRSSGSSGSSGSSSSSSSSGSSGGSSGRMFIRPVTGTWYVTSPYGYRIYPITGGRFFHRGVDLRSHCGEAQRATAAGTVVGVRPARGNGTHGNQVLINHGVMGGNSYVTVTNHLSRFAVRQGQRVSQGQVIGYTGATGMVTGCHVHFEIWRNGSTIDPMTMLR